MRRLQCRWPSSSRCRHCRPVLCKKRPSQLSFKLQTNISSMVLNSMADHVYLALLEDRSSTCFALFCKTESGRRPSILSHTSFAALSAHTCSTRFSTIVAASTKGSANCSAGARVRVGAVTAGRCCGKDHAISAHKQHKEIWRLILRNIT